VRKVGQLFQPEGQVDERLGIGDVEDQQHGVGQPVVVLAQASKSFLKTV
jgi:hypothetical protein